MDGYEFIIFSGLLALVADFTRALTFMVMVVVLVSLLYQDQGSIPFTAPYPLHLFGLTLS